MMGIDDEELNVSKISAYNNIILDNKKIINLKKGIGIDNMHLHSNDHTKYWHVIHIASYCYYGNQ